MRVSINNELKIVQFWCDSKEAEKPEFKDTINNLFKEFAPSDKYRKVIYRSGNMDLTNLTANLLNHNVGLTA